MIKIKGRWTKIAKRKDSEFNKKLFVATIRVWESLLLKGLISFVKKRTGCQFIPCYLSWLAPKRATPYFQRQNELSRCRPSFLLQERERKKKKRKIPPPFLIHPPHLAYLSWKHQPFLPIRFFSFNSFPLVICYSRDWYRTRSFRSSKFSL